MVRFQTNHNVAFVEEDAKSTASRLNNLQNDLAQLKRDSRLLESFNNAPQPLRTSEKTDGNGTDFREQDRARQQLAQLEQQRREMDKLYWPKHPKMIKIAEQIAAQSN